MATRFKSRARRSRRYLTIVKPSGSLHPRVQKVGPEHFGIVAVDCAKARFRGSMRFRLGECEGRNNSVMPSRAANGCTTALR